MRICFSFPAVLTAGLLACLAAPAASAQPSFALQDPVLVADGRTVPVEGAPLAQERFGALVLAVPGVATYTVSDRPFEGSRLAGQFENDGLYFAAEGVSVRLLSDVPILGPERRGAYVRTSRAAGPGGSARVALAVPARSEARRTQTTPQSARGRAPSADPERQTELRAEVARLRQQLSQLAAEREQAVREGDRDRQALQTSLDRVTAERDALRAERDRALAERSALGTEMERVRRDAERATERGRAAEATRHRQALDRIRAEVVSRDETIALLTEERDERGTQVARLTTELERVHGLLTQTRAERDAARADLATLRERAAPEAAESSRLRVEMDRLGEALAQTRAERDRLAELTSVQAPELASGEAEIDRLQTELATVRQRLSDSIARQSETEEAMASLQAETAGLREERDALRASGEADTSLEAERDRLVQRIQALEAEVTRLRREARAPEASAPVPPSPQLPPRPASGAVVSFPDFDTDRLTNLGEITDRIARLDMGSQAQAGEVLVLFQTDTEGRVIRTAVARRIGNGLDEVAESLVQSMRFSPPTVDGQPTGLRSQVRVRFGA